MTGFTARDFRPALKGKVVRFRPLVHLGAGDLLGCLAEQAWAYDDRPAFGAANDNHPTLSAALWLAQHVERVASAIVASEETSRPILIQAPAAALTDSNTALACAASVGRTILCPQEFCLMFTDAALASDFEAAAAALLGLRRHGFRVGVDMQKSWQAPLPASLRLAVDTILVDSRRLNDCEHLADMVDAASAAGILVAATHARWRDSGALQDMGIAAALAPRADA